MCIRDRFGRPQSRNGLESRFLAKSPGVLPRQESGRPANGAGDFAKTEIPNHSEIAVAQNTAASKNSENSAIFQPMPA
eukprot:2190402-Lingulodinium_polyedra.AAC.1